ncbi:zinc-dependent metalloprotease [Tahibacter amnicola]|uniref:Zinc-dependent metalloprotease n=1 Tax=Tahibacter amnicola TaxID=2976241 RepID=A0ABY6BRC5_9GAMM|nr:zinc-dependent metalloprotease [Tahibacter amnicola]UXI70317.1 zinc-dependent metalloprotease [Tahibacter amnicola]
MKSAVLASLLATATPAFATANLISFDIPTTTSSRTAFLDTSAHVQPSATSDAGAVAAWNVTVNAALFASLPQTVVLNFPDRPSVTLNKDVGKHREPAGFLWTGRGGGCSGIFTSVRNILRGTISCQNAAYGLEPPRHAQATQLIRYDSALVAVDANDTERVASPNAHAANLSKKSAMAAAESVDTSIDILVLYTEGVRAALDPGGGNANSLAYMQHAVDVTQQAMTNSTTAGQPVIAEVALAKAQKVQYPGSGSFSTDLTYLTDDPEPTGLRNYWSADIVMLVAESGGVGQCGRAFEPAFGLPPPGPSFAPFAVAVAKRACSFANFSFQHEFAHVIGANHNPESETNPTPLRPWAYDHWISTPKGVKNRTIMTYPSVCPYGCPEVLHYANAQVYAGDFRTGTPNLRENARAIAEFSSAAAQYRPHLGRIFADRFE